MTENKIEEENQQKPFQKELIFFKNDILSDFKSIESKIKIKLTDLSNNIEVKLSDYEKKLEIFSEKIFNLSNLIIVDKTIKEKIDKLEKFKEKINEQSLNNEIKIDIINKDLRNSIFKYDKIFSDNIFYHGLIGNNCKYKNLHEFIDFILSQFSIFNNFKDKNIIDFKFYKNKLENLIQNFKLQFDNINKNLKEFTNKKFFECEEKMKDYFIIHEKKLQELKGENINNLKELNYNNNNQNIEIEKIENNNNKININSNNINIKENNELLGLSNKYENMKTDLNLMKMKLNKLNDYIKDIILKINSLEEIQNKQIIEINEKKQNFKNNNRNNEINNIHIINYIT